MQKANYAPIYAACIYPELAESFRSKGWALAVHGSLARDFDLVAIPWHHDPVRPQACVDSVCHYHAMTQVGPAAIKEHGRKVFTLALSFGECFLDLSFMPTQPANSNSQLDWDMVRVSG